MTKNTDPKYNAKYDMKSNRLNDEVCLLAGCTLKEILAVATITLIISLIIMMMPIYVCFRNYTIGLAASLVVYLPLFSVLIIKLSKLKRGKPEGYYQQYIILKLIKIGILKNQFLLRSGVWSTERKKQ
jgi:conjugative transfer region protein (TIGR03750 family)